MGRKITMGQAFKEGGKILVATIVAWFCVAILQVGAYFVAFKWNGIGSTIALLLGLTAFVIAIGLTGYFYLRFWRR